MIEFENISKKYPNGKVAVEDINLKFETGEFICLIGTSGSGKTTCMRMINRMLEPSTGKILIDGKDILEYNEVDLRRHIGYVIQQIGLMPHMTIYQNIVMVPKLLKWSEEKMRAVAEELIDRVDLPRSFLDRYPSELSGGQQQRIGVIRALAADQNIILMDEPFGALDPLTRESLQKLVKKLQVELGKTVVFVTHDIDEAIKLGDKVAIMDSGSVVQFDTVENILLNPANDFVKNLIGEDRLNEAQFNIDVVENIMMRNPYTINVNDKASNILTMMHKNRVDTLFVVDDEHKLLGVVDIFDSRKSIFKGEHIKDFMKHAESISVDTKVKDAAYYINTLQYRNLPVVNDDNVLVGIVTRAVIVDCVYENFWKGYIPEDEQHEEE
ncbi:ABC transporter ATP-binding protein [Peptostreptococcus faecalis]|uniref:ABC transporter ATP-binding protein n=1 Tax=Peptostreptococcus faecalis TaxID=2045015 RepID=UPI000C7A177F|nr:betaine/proline/choline family ABC transporter ATP-binding protein [Peptostreptococcus faecalis]